MLINDMLIKKTCIFSQIYILRDVVKKFQDINLQKNRVSTARACVRGKGIINK